MQEKPTFVYIPPNVGGADGSTPIGISVRNLIETGIAIILTLVLRVLIGKIIPFAIVGWLVIFMGLGLIIACATGINGEPLSLFIVNVINYNNRRVFVTMRPPVPKKKEEKEPAEDGIDRKLQNIFTKKAGKKRKKEENA